MVTWEFPSEEEFEDFKKAMRRKKLLLSFTAYTSDGELWISCEWEDETEAIFRLTRTNENTVEKGGLKNDRLGKRNTIYSL